MEVSMYLILVMQFLTYVIAKHLAGDKNMTTPRAIMLLATVLSFTALNIMSLTIIVIRNLPFFD